MADGKKDFWKREVLHENFYFFFPASQSFGILNILVWLVYRAHSSGLQLDFTIQTPSTTRSEIYNFGNFLSCLF